MTLTTFDRAVRSIHYAHEIAQGSPLSPTVERAQQAFDEPVEIVYEVEGGYIVQTATEAVFLGDDGEFALTDIHEVAKGKRDYRKEYDDYHAKPGQKKNRAARNAARASKGLEVGDKREVDHKVPLSKGGDNDDSNLRVVSRETNRSKGDSEESVDETITRTQLNSLERAIDKLFAAANIDVEFTKHFMDRVNDARNGTDITIEELAGLFRETWKKFRKTLEKAKPNWNAILQDVSTSINIPIVMDVNKYGELELVAKTVMRKKGFTGRAKRLVVKSESFDEAFESMLDEATTLNVSNTPLAKARAYAEKVFDKAGKTLDEVIPDFDKNYTTLQKVMKRALNIPRVQMPVIEPADMKTFLTRIKSGSIDILQPWAKGKLHAPTSLSKQEGKEWVKLGFEDGDDNDDKLSAKLTRKPANKLLPTQSQIWLEKLIENIVKFGVPSSSSPIAKATIIVSKEGFILDGHHRFGQAMLANPTLALSTLLVPLDIKLLLKVGRAYGEAIGNTVKEAEIEEAWTRKKLIAAAEASPKHTVKQALYGTVVTKGKRGPGIYMYGDGAIHRTDVHISVMVNIRTVKAAANLLDLKESMDEADVEEGINDKYILKAVFMTGGAGAGKSFISDLMFGGTGLKVVNSDTQLERAMKAAGLDVKADMASQQVQREGGIRDKARDITIKRLDLYVKGRLGLIIDSTAAKVQKVEKQVAMLRKLGYDCSMVFVNTSLETSLARNQQRPRTVPEPVVKKDWNLVQANLRKYRALFGQKSFREIINDEVLSPKQIASRLTPQLTRMAMPMLNAPVKNSIGKKWIQDEKARLGISPTGAVMPLAASHDSEDLLTEDMSCTELECLYVDEMAHALQTAIQQNPNDVHRVAHHFGEFESAVEEGEFEKAEMLYGVIVKALPLDGVLERSMSARHSQVSNVRRGTTKEIQSGAKNKGQVRGENRKRRIAARSKHKMTSSRVQRTRRSMSSASESGHSVHDPLDEAESFVRRIYNALSKSGKSLTADQVADLLKLPKFAADRNGDSRKEMLIQLDGLTRGYLHKDMSVKRTGKTYTAESIDEDTNVHGIKFEERQLVSMYDDEDAATRGTFEDWRAKHFSQLDEGQVEYDKAFRVGWVAAKAEDAVTGKPSRTTAKKAHKSSYNRHGYEDFMEGYLAYIDTKAGAYAQPGPKRAKQMGLKESIDEAKKSDIVLTSQISKEGNSVRMKISGKVGQIAIKGEVRALHMHIEGAGTYSAADSDTTLNRKSGNLRSPEISYATRRKVVDAVVHERQKQFDLWTERQRIRRRDESTDEAIISVKITAGKDSWTTSIQGPLAKAQAYFMGKTFNIGDGSGGDRMTKKVTKVELSESVDEASAAFDTLNDAAIYDAGYAKGSTEIWYAGDKAARALTMGLAFLQRREPQNVPTLKTYKTSHKLLGKIAEKRPERIFGMMQGELWSREGEANTMLRRLGIHHTSMSVGDIIKIGNKVLFVDRDGFTPLS